MTERKRKFKIRAARLYLAQAREYRRFNSSQWRRVAAHNLSRAAIVRREIMESS